MVLYVMVGCQLKFPAIFLSLRKWRLMSDLSKFPVIFFVLRNRGYMSDLSEMSRACPANSDLSSPFRGCLKLMRGPPKWPSHGGLFTRFPHMRYYHSIIYGLLRQVLFKPSAEVDAPFLDMCHLIPQHVMLCI